MASVDSSPSSGPTHLPDLSQEVWDMILNQLPLNSQISLRMLSRILYSCTPAFTTLMDRVMESSDLMFERVCMDERDTSHRLNDRLACSACRTRHDADAFTQEEVGKSGEERVCKGQLGKVYLTHDHTIRFRELRASQHAVYKVRGQLAIGRTVVGVLGEESSSAPVAGAEKKDMPTLPASIRWSKHLLGGIRVTYEWYLDLGPRPSGNQLLRADWLERKLVGYAISFCPHIQASHPRVVDGILYCHENAYSGLQDLVACTICETSTKLEFHLNKRGNYAEYPPRLFVTVVVTRSFGHAISAQDPLWLNQMVL